MEAEAALHCEDISNSKGEEGPADTWEWVIFHLDRVNIITFLFSDFNPLTMDLFGRDGSLVLT